MSERVFVNPVARRVGLLIDTVFKSTWPPGSPEFTEAVTDLVNRLEPNYLLYFLVYPEEGEPPPAPQSFAKTCRSFGEGRFYSEVKPRALVVDLFANRSLLPLVSSWGCRGQLVTPLTIWRRFWTGRRTRTRRLICCKRSVSWPMRGGRSFI
jgi:hypothetical protein